MFFINLWFGYSINKPIISELIPNKPAEISGLEVGDTILIVNNSKIETFEDIKENIKDLNGEVRICC